MKLFCILLCCVSDSLFVGNSTIVVYLSQLSKNLGVTFDMHLNLATQVKKLKKDPNLIQIASFEL